MSCPRPLSRPWYCNDELVEFYKLLGGWTGMSLKTLKLVKATLTNVLVAGVGLYAMHTGADPTTVGGATVIALAALNGVELSEWVAAKQALREIDVERRREQQNRRR